VLALPIKIRPGQTMGDLVTLLLAQVDCRNCDAPCCRANPWGAGTGLPPLEYQRLSEKYGKERFIMKDGMAYLPMPCPFLREAPRQKENLCTIYPDRPLACVLYPFQPGAADDAGEAVLALSSSCPSARHLARDIYMTAWRLRRQFKLLGEEDFLRGIL